jgi:ABC-type Mn2+/Zn2+ transport system ATPase subunit
MNLDVRRGELWFLIGTNGTGKTTFLRGVLGTLSPLAGELTLAAELSDRRRIGYVPQTSQLNPTLPTTLREFVRLGFVRSAVSKSHRQQERASALARVGLQGHELDSYWSLSGGQRQRALVARALVRRPELLLVDEPTGGLDVAAEDAFRRTVLSLNQESALTLLFVTHNLHLAARIATHVALFETGGVVTTGTASELLRHEVIERAFGISVDLARDGRS